MMHRSHLKKVFSSDIGVEPSYQVLDIFEYACGLILGLALISTENSNFEIASMWNGAILYELKFETVLNTLKKDYHGYALTAPGFDLP